MNVHIVNGSMRSSSGMVDEVLYTQNVADVEGYSFLSLYSFSCIGQQATTAKQL